MANTNSLKKGELLEIEDSVCRVVDFKHVKPGKGQAFVRIVLKDMETGRVQDKKFRSGQYIPNADIERKDAQFLYADDQGVHFMDENTFEQFALPEDVLGESIYYLTDGLKVLLLFYKNRCLDIDLPTSVALKVADTEPGIRGNTVSGATKSATLETGLTLQIPLFIEPGEVIKVDTRTGEYIERAGS